VWGKEKKNMNTPKRYHPVLVTLHWLTVVLLLGAGLLSESGGRSPISIHMILGALLLVVMLIRLVVRLTTKHPAWADTGNALLNKLGEAMHYALYLVVFFILGIGAAMANSRGLIAYALGSSAKVTRPGAIKGLHELGWTFAVLLVMGHVGAALYHQFILKDKLLSRMWYGASE
jgi:cytochrome b561